MNIITLGAHVLDILVHPVDSIPEGQQTALVENIHISPAGTAGGTAVVLSKLGATVRTAGAIGTDPNGDLLLSLLQRHGVDISLLVRKPAHPTATTVLPIRPNGDRPTWHLLGANPFYTADDINWDAIASADYLHLGGPELLGPDLSSRILRHAKESGAVTSADLLAPGSMGSIDAIAPILPHVDYFLPNEEQALGFTKTTDLLAACHILHSAGAGTLAITRGAEGALLFSSSTIQEIPAYKTKVVDTTGCGDAFTAGFLRALDLGRRPHEAAELACATAALAAQGLGTDYGDFDLATVERRATH
ncbi:carbohydrate kinase family protein [Nocardia sp. 2]|uniref:Carbohydrate kinase family protein n=1 Tax=Nocardia acididurans TaxID=2802282 RepID=A0ABS1MH61_9NOCA|nr:carbohydrate kinase family protein [Nocardia acididurans]MBL1080007.1 carbohydrate kinase family protein [Nocardia acididurans]